MGQNIQLVRGGARQETIAPSELKHRVFFIFKMVTESQLQYFHPAMTI